MLNVCKLNGFYDRRIFRIRAYEGRSAYLIDDVADEEINEGIAGKCILLHEPSTNRYETYHFRESAHGLDRWFRRNESIIFYIRFTEGQRFLHIHKVDCGRWTPRAQPADESIQTKRMTKAGNEFESALEAEPELVIFLPEYIGHEPILRYELRQIDERYCLFGVATDRNYQINKLLLIDFAARTVCEGNPELPGQDSLFRAEHIFKMDHRDRQWIGIKTTSIHWREKYELWNDPAKRETYKDDLVEQLLLCELEAYISSVKKGEPFPMVAGRVVERCPLHQHLLWWQADERGLNYCLHDFEQHETILVTYGVDHGSEGRTGFGKKERVVVAGSLLEEASYRNGSVYAVEALEQGGSVFRNVTSGRVIFEASPHEGLLFADEDMAITYVWLQDSNQQMIYYYDLAEGGREGQLLGIGFAQFDDRAKVLTIFS
ncbi:hypothetical protein [Paenibacillus turpanensis]|uniref:hypothetical protein n=1 Tax=Paenibacillus turpanensis TaxID=2689078 RepID=UPI00140A47E2|nr:hypothetical protein [Paenibacillus turpanensis]